MNKSFILRFQEDCQELENGPSGTKTVTNFRAEASDSDWNRSSYGVMQLNSVLTGTETKTAVAKEGSDTDKVFQPIRGCQSSAQLTAGTQTQTRIRAEAPDEDRGADQFCIIPPCFSS